MFRNIQIQKFNENYKKKIISLGGITEKNLKRLNLLKIYGIAAISLFNKYKN